MERFLKMIKIGDIVIVAVLVILSFLPLAIFSYQENVSATGSDPTNEHLHVVISADGETVHEMTLKNDHVRETYEYEDEHGNKNVITREGEKVFISEANCSDYLCVQQGEIREAGETIVCLPHKVLVEVTSNGSNTNDDIDIISQ